MMRAVVSGGLSQPFDQAAALSTLVGNVANAIETVEILERLTSLEERFGAKGSNP
jgi:hypothetical protein